MGAYIREKFEGRHVLASITYRNLAPLYCDEEMRICCKVRKSLDTGHIYDVWIEGPTGGAAVIGTVRTAKSPSTKGERKAAYRSEEYTARKGTTGLEGLTIKRVENSLGNTDPNSWRAVDTAGRGPRSNELEATSNQAPQLNEEGKAVKPVRHVSRSPISPTLDPQPRNVRRARTGELEGTPTGLSPHKSYRLKQPSQPSLSKFTILPLPSRYDNVNEDSSSKSNTVVSRDMPTESPQRSHHRNRSARTEARTDLRKTTSPQIHLVKSLSTPVKHDTSSRQKEINHPLDGPESKHVAVSVSAPKTPNLIARPTSVIRRYKGQPYQSDPAAISARHSRYMRHGIRKIDQPRIVQHGRTLSRSRRERD
jgi:hypothetical protein